MEGRDDISLEVNESSLLPTLVTNSEKQPSFSSLKSLDACIYRVPKKFFEQNKDAYTPQIVSIGPYHHGKEWLKGMEAFKERYLEDFLNRSQKSKEELTGIIKVTEEKLRGSYFEPIALESDELVKVVLQDAAFIFELFYRIAFFGLHFDDCLAQKRILVDLIREDMLILENQLPFFILEDLLDFANIRAPLDLEEDNGFKENEKISLLELTYHFFKPSVDLRVHLHSTENFNSNDFLHFVDFFRNCLVPVDDAVIQDKAAPYELFESIPTITELHQAGVKFKKARSISLFDIKFDSKAGVLEIPYFCLGPRVETLFRNMLLFEQFHYPNSLLLTDYLKFLDYLVDTPRDVEMLVRNHIILNRLGENTAAANFLNGIAHGTTFYPSTFYFYEICEELRSYYRDPRHRLIANLKQNYFNTPWAGISVAAAVVLLGVTILGAVYPMIK